METREAIMEATIEEFNDKGIKFTMDDVAKRLGMSKKTIYLHFEDKTTLFLNTVDYCFTAIKECENKLLNDETLSLTDKIRKILIVLPERYHSIDWRQVYLIKDRYPKIYEQIVRRLESDWESTIVLLEQGIKEGCIKPISIPVLKVIVEASIAHFLNSPQLIEDDISYEMALEHLISIIMDGICINK